ncbi:hypothetical protein C8R44DRAFT_755460 [Mycena epipterygia]|nr:hypothetical protein C8R44DRAFT_755460 [Mycena epipterygia]
MTLDRVERCARGEGWHSLCSTTIAADSMKIVMGGARISAISSTEGSTLSGLKPSGAQTQDSVCAENPSRDATISGDNGTSAVDTGDETSNTAQINGSMQTALERNIIINGGQGGNGGEGGGTGSAGGGLSTLAFAYLHLALLGYL